MYLGVVHGGVADDPHISAAAHTVSRQMDLDQVVIRAVTLLAHGKIAVVLRKVSRRLEAVGTQVSRHASIQIQTVDVRGVGRFGKERIIGAKRKGVYS